jgi:flagellar basal-body rod protein FlgB
VQYRNAVQQSLDGNTVDMDVERAAFADNALQYQSTLTFLSKRISS